jgi:3-deoxy-D-manno-octulosonate 8-phosphate phosphatase (KDO 8-P phosphatase)
VKLIAMDVDGVLTDGTAFFGSGGFEGLFFNVQDGAAVKWLHRAGLKTALITGRTVEAVKARARALGIEMVYQDAKVKLEVYEQLLKDARVPARSICYVGDDLPDLPVMRRVGLAVAVANARPEVKAAAHVVTEASGGRGAVRELAELILKTQGHWEELTRRYFE